MSTSDQTLNAFLDKKELGILARGIAFRKTSQFVRGEHAFAVSWFMWIGCVPCMAPIATFRPESTFKHFSLELYPDRLEVAFPINCCCSISITKTTVLLDSIMDVTLNAEDKFNAPYGLKQMDIWALGDDEKTGPSASVPWLADPEQAREAILLAVRLRREAAGCVPYPPSAVPTSLDQANDAAAAGAAAGGGAADVSQRGGGVDVEGVRPEIAAAPSR